MQHIGLLPQYRVEQALAHDADANDPDRNAAGLHVHPFACCFGKFTQPGAHERIIYLRGAVGGVLVQPTVGQFDANPRASRMQATTDSPR